MGTMMNTIGGNSGFIVLWALHVLSVVAFFTGVLFLIVFAVKTFTPAQLKSRALWLIIGGTVVCIFTIAMIGRPWIGKHSWSAGMGGMQMERMGQMMEMMMEHDQGTSGSPHDDHQEMQNMMRMMMGAPRK